MSDRFRLLLDRPLDPRAARAILVFASAILAGFTVLFVLASRQAESPTPPTHLSQAIPSPSPSVPIQAFEGNPGEGQAPHRQDPQDVEGSTAARKAARALRSHRALQHIPYRHAKLAITLAGARAERAVLQVSAPSLRAARRGWSAFLRRYHDRGKAYIAHFVFRRHGRSR